MFLSMLHLNICGLGRVSKGANGISVEPTHRKLEIIALFWVWEQTRVHQSNQLPDRRISN